MEAIVAIKAHPRKARSIAESLSNTRNFDKVLLLESNEVMAWIKFEDTDALTNALRQIRNMPGIKSTETKVVLHKSEVSGS